jgi:hypothetical protein
LAHAKKRKKHLKKTLQIRMFLCTPKCIFISGPSDLAHAKIIEKRPKNHPKSQTTPLRNNKMSQLLHLQKNLKINQKSAHQFTRSLKYENLQKISSTRLVGAKFLAYFDT